MQDLGTLGADKSYGRGINNKGQIVGECVYTSTQTAFLYSDGTMRDLNELIGPTSGWNLVEANAINDRGWITGSGWHGGQLHAYLLTPVPEPATLALLGLLFVPIVRRSAARLSVPALVLALATAFQAPTQAAISYTVTDLGTLGGSQSYAYGINNAGQVVGYSFPTGELNGLARAFVYTDGVMTDLGAPVGTESFAYAIDEAGLVVGRAEGQAVMYSGGTISSLGTPPGSASPYGCAYAINNSGQIVGWAQVAWAHGFICSSGQVSDLGTLPGALYSYAYGINDSGQVVGMAASVGHSYPHAVLFAGGAVSDLGTLPGGTNSSATAINALGQIVGWSFADGGTDPHAFLLTNGQMLDLGLGSALAINDNGDTVGSGAFFYSAGVRSDLNALIDPTLGWTLQDATGINDKGQIVGYGLSPAGETHAFLLTPIPEPATLSLLLSLATLRRRQCI